MDADFIDVSHLVEIPAALTVRDEDDLAGEAVSPELVLVDPDLGARARAALVVPRERVETVLTLVPPVVETLQQRSVARPQREPIEPLRTPRRRSRRIWAVLGGLAGFAALAALAFDVHVQFGDPKDPTAAAAGVDPGTAGAVRTSPPQSNRTTLPEARGTARPEKGSQTARPKPKATARPEKGSRASRPRAKATARTDTSSAPSRRARAGAATKKSATRARNAPAKTAAQTSGPGRRFAWAPVARATRYHVELFRGTSRVFAASTRRPSIVIPRRWRFEGRLHELEPGDYRWYVWPEFKDRGRATAASVQARLSVS